MKNPWKKLGSKAIYKNPWITVREDKVIRPDGKKGMKVMKVPIKQAIKLIMEDKIFDGSAIIGIFKAVEYLKGKSKKAKI